MQQRGMDVAVDEIYRTESRRVLATLIRLLGSFDLAEEAVHDAFQAAVEQWPKEGVPANPRAWLVSTGRFKAIDKLRRQRRFVALDDAAVDIENLPDERNEVQVEEIEDDRLRLIFTCCHPALSIDAQIALTLREVCGLATEAIASAFLIPAATLAQRIVRAKNKIRDARIPYEVPGTEQLPERLDAVLHVLYLIFNEGYFASSGDKLMRTDLSDEAIRLTRLLLALLPDAEVKGLLALMLLTEARRAARQNMAGEIVLLEKQDRSLWNAALISEGLELVGQALSARRFGAYALQAAIAAVHAEAKTADETDWAQIVALYDVLMRTAPSAVVELNRAVAIAMRDGAAAGLSLIEAIHAEGKLRDYPPLYSAQAELLRRMGRKDEARAVYQDALALTKQQAERRFLEKQLHALNDGSNG